MDQRVNGSLVLIGANAGAVSVQAQPSGGALTLQLPNILPSVGNFLTVQQITAGNIVVLGWSSFTQSPIFTGTSTVANIRVTGTYADGNNSVGTNGQILSSTGTKTVWITVPSATPGSPSGSLQFNNSGVFTGTSGLNWDNTNQFLTLNTGANPNAGLNVSVVNGTVALNLDGTGLFITEQINSGQVILSITETAGFTVLDNSGFFGGTQSGISLISNHNPVTFGGSGMLLAANGLINSVAGAQLRINANGIGFNTSPAAFPNVTGQTSDAALTSLLTQLATIGFIQNNTTVVQPILRRATVTLTGAQVTALGATPIQIVPAPGAGLTIVPISSFWSYTGGSTAFSSVTGSSASIQVAPAGDPGGNFYSNVLLGNTLGALDLTVLTSQVAIGGSPFAGDFTSNVVNQALVVALYSGTAFVGASDGTLKVVVYYTIEAA